MSKKKITYESAIAELQEIVSELQEETISMDDLSAKIRRAAELVKFCQEKLRGVEQEMKEVFDNE